MAFSIPFLPRKSRPALVAPALTEDQIMGMEIERDYRQCEQALDAFADHVYALPDADLDIARNVEAWAYQNVGRITKTVLIARYNDAVWRAAGGSR